MAEAAEVPEPARKTSEPDLSKTERSTRKSSRRDDLTSERSKGHRKSSSGNDLSESRQSRKKLSSAHLGPEKSEKDETKTSRKSHSPSHKREREGTTAAEEQPEVVGGPTKEEEAAALFAANKEYISPISPSQPFKPQTTTETSPLPPTATAGISRSDGRDLLKERLVLGCVVFCFMCIVAIMVFMEAFNKREAIKTDTPCFGRECQEVVEFTEAMMDQSVSPCVDFYRHVCGYWIKNTERPSSFMADVAHNFSIALHKAISENKGAGEHAELRKSASVFYKSCIAFVERNADLEATTEELFKALNISVADWLKMTDHVQLFDNIVHLSLVNRFHALVTVSIFQYETDETLQVYRVPAFHSLVREIYHAHLAEYLGKLVKSISHNEASEAVIKEVVTLDKKRAEKSPTDGDTQVSLSEIKCNNFPGKMWKAALENYISLSEDIKVTTGVDGAICDDLNSVLIDTKTVARPLYVLVQVTAHVLKYDYELSENREASALRDVCYHATTSAFEDVWPHLLSGFLSINKWIEEVVDAYMQYIKLVLKIQINNWTWMAEEDKSATVKKLDMMHFARFYGTSMSKEAVQCSSGKQVTDTSFVSNMVHLKYRDVKNCMFLSVNRSEALIRQMLLGNELAVDRSSLTVVLPPMFVVPPMYYRQVEDDKFINIAVLGTQFARKVVSITDRKSSYKAAIDDTKNATSSWSQGTLANYSAFQECYHNKSARLHEKLNGDQFDEAFNVMMAMRIAFEGKRDHERAFVKNSHNKEQASNVMLFKRSCLSLCAARGATQDGNTLDYTTAYAACLFGAANGPKFGESFGCKPGDTMVDIGSCYAG